MSINCIHQKNILLEAAKKGDIDDIKTIQEAISKGDELDVEDNVGNTPLILASSCGRTVIVMELVKGKAKVNAVNKMNRNAIFAAAANSHSGIIDILMKAGCKADCADKFGETPLMVAAKNGYDGAVTTLFEKGPGMNATLENSIDINATNQKGESALHLACKEGDISIAQLLLRYGANVDLQDKMKRTPLRIAVERGHEACIQQLLLAKPDLDSLNQIDSVLLSKLDIRNYTVELFIKANLGCAKAQYNLAHYYERGWRVKENIKRAIELYEKASNEDNEDAGSCLIADRQRYINTILLLLNVSANPELPKQNYRSPLLLTAKEEMESCMKTLLRPRPQIESQGIFDEMFLLHIKNRLMEIIVKAIQGNAEAQVNLAICFEYGKGVEKDIKMAVELYKKAAYQDHPRAIAILGYFYDLGIGVEKDQKKAVEFYERAANLGNAQAQSNLGNFYKFGNVVEKNSNKAFELFTKSAEQGNADGEINLGVCFNHGIGIEKDLKKAAELYKKASDRGYALAQVNLGVLYEYGDGVDKDIKKAIELYRLAANQNYPRARHYLGICFEEGTGVEKNINIAIDYYLKAACQGYAKSYYRLGQLYTQGIDVGKNMEKAVSFYQNGAELGDAEALGNLGVCYERGVVVKKDLKKAIDLFRQATELGDDWAKKNLQHTLKKLLTLPISAIIEYFDIFEIIDTYHYAISIGLTDAYNNLAKLYEEGPYHFPQDLYKSLEFYRDYQKSQMENKVVNEKINALSPMSAIYDNVVEAYSTYEIVPEKGVTQGHRHMPDKICKLISEYAVQKI